MDTIINNLFENFCMVFTLSLLSYAAATFKQTMTQAMSRNYAFKLTDLIFILIGATFSFCNFQLWIFVAKKYFGPFLSKNCRPGESWEAKLSRVGSHFSGFVFYTISTSFLFLYYKDSELLPLYYGGTLRLGTHDPKIPQRLDLGGEFIYLFMMGHSVHRTIKVYIHQRKSNNFW